MNHTASNYFKLANASLIDGRVDEAISLYNLAINEQPDFFLYYENLGRALLRLKNKEAEAEKAFHKAAELNNKAVWSTYYLGRFYAHKNDYANSIYWLHRAAAIDRNPIIMELLGIVYYQTGNMEKAFSTFKDMKKRSLLSAECCVRRLQNKINIGFESLFNYLMEDESHDFESNRKNTDSPLHEIVEVDPDYVDAYVKRGDMLICKEQWGKAQIEFYNAIRALLFSGNSS